MFPLIATALGLVACSTNGNDVFINKGFDATYGQTCVPCRVGVGIKCLKEQSTRLKFDVYFGATKGYDEDWENNNIALDKEFQKTESTYFALKRTISDYNSNAIDNNYSVIDDFPNFKKYPYYQTYIEGTDDGYVTSFDYYLTDEFDILDYADISKGKISYTMVLYDINNKEEIDLNFDTGGETVHFEVVDSNIVYLS